MTASVWEALTTHREVIGGLESDETAALLEKTAGAMARALEQGHKVLVMGNGGSAADAQHLAGELVGRFLRERRALPAVALTTDTSVLTAVGNDYGYEQVFARQVEALAEAGDVCVGISTSGGSRNVVLALEKARDKGCVTVGLTGRDGGEVGRRSDLWIGVPSSKTPRIQEAHILVIHILCDLVEQRFV